VRILIFTVGRNGPQPGACYLFSPAASSDPSDSFDGIDVILKLQGDHFTLLRPLDENASSSPIDQIRGLFKDITPVLPLHLQSGDAAKIVKDTGRVQSLAQLHGMHCPAHAAAPAPISPPITQQTGESASYD
jgi:hypothetical protein